MNNTYILESLEAAPPVTLATSNWDNSFLSSSSCFRSSSFFFPRSSWAFTFTYNSIYQINVMNKTQLWPTLWAASSVKFEYCEHNIPRDSCKKSLQHDCLKVAVPLNWQRFIANSLHWLKPSQLVPGLWSSTAQSFPICSMFAPHEQ